LAYNQHSGNPVRVVREASGDPAHSPPSGFRYDGLFRVEGSWVEEAPSGFRVVRFRLKKLSEFEDEHFHPPRCLHKLPHPGSLTRPGIVGDSKP